MLSELLITNFAIIDDLHLRFEPGFNVLTGETGAGKSIIIDAVSLLLGARGDVEYVRAGADQASIEAHFRVDGPVWERVEPLLERDELLGEEPRRLILAREIRRNGRNVCRINGRAVTLRALQGVGELLVDIHGQSEHLSLLRVKEHVNLLDRFGGLWPLRNQVAGTVQELRRVRRELAALQRDERELARRVDLLEYQVNEIDAARLEPGEDATLQQERTRLANAEQLTELAQEAYTALYEGGEDQASAVDLVQIALRALHALARLDSSLEATAQRADELGYALDDLASSLLDYRDSIEYNPRRLNQVEERLAVIHSLQRKYGATIEDVLAFAERTREELDGIEHAEERIEELQAQEESLLHKVGRLGAELSARRREAVDQLAALVEAELEQLNMAPARFAADLAWRDDADGAYVPGRRVAFDAAGLDRVEFLVAPNVGEPLKPLVRIASGGETSRLMLALKTVLSAADQTPTLIFDEIDSGIGGRVGSVVGRKLWGLTIANGSDAISHQVLCVTHLPQLASFGDLHVKVEKQIVGERTVTRIRPLETEARVKEVAVMLGSESDATQQSAREMLSRAEQDKQAADDGAA